jgi:hypothetical protein
MNVEDQADVAASRIAAAIGEPARARMLYSLMDGRARTSTELAVIAGGGQRDRFVPTTPNRLRAARTCYDHMAGTAAVALHDRFVALGLLAAVLKNDTAYDLTAKGSKALESLGIDVGATRALRRRFAYGCLDWSERRPHIGGAIGAALLESFLRKRWVSQDFDSRALSLTGTGRREFKARFGVSLETPSDEASVHSAVAGGYQRRSG